MRWNDLKRGAWVPFFLVLGATYAEPPTVMPQGERSPDARLAPLVRLDRSEFLFTPPDSADAWSERRETVRRQVLVAAGLWPMPRRHSPRAFVHGRVERDDYTIDRVYLESYPGHYVTGSLYRPKGRSGPRPAILSPHGHFREGRFHAWSDQELAEEMRLGGEKLAVGGRYPLQARCVQLVRMGCIVFLYDMLGYADSVQLDLGTIHNTRLPPDTAEEGQPVFYSVAAELQLQSPLGLQLANSLYALDWLASLPDVDPARIGITGASGGGSQTFLLCAVDDRPAAAFPAVMVSTAMQGGCGCENACGLRVGTGNVEFAALFAPRPLGMTTADDWTKEMSRKGYPELQQLYAMLDADDKLMLADLTEFPHNFNHPSRRAMYEWFRHWLDLGEDASVEEQEFDPLSREEATVWNKTHPRPTSGREHEIELLSEMTIANRQMLRRLRPHDQASAAEYREIVGGAFETLLSGAKTHSHRARFEAHGSRQLEGAKLEWGLSRDDDSGVALPTLVLRPDQFAGEFVVMTALEGKSDLWTEERTLRDEVTLLLENGIGVVAGDLYDQGEFRTGDMPEEVASRTNGDDRIAAITYGYNLSPLAQRGHDLLRLADAARHLSPEVTEVYLVALRGSAPYAAAALALDPGVFAGAALDTQGFRFAQLDQWRHIHFLPGSVKYGDLPGLLALAAPCPLWIGGEGGQLPEPIGASYVAHGASRGLVSEETQQPARDAVQFILGLVPAEAK